MFKKDTIGFGLLISTASIIISAAFVFFVLFIIGIPIYGNMRFFLLAFFPNIILIRYYLKNLHYLKTGNTLIVVLFVCMFSFFVYLLKTGQLNIFNL